jgi:hypothetical protein
VPYRTDTFIVHPSFVGRVGFFFSGHLHCEPDYHNVYPVTCSTSKNDVFSDLAIMEVTISYCYSFTVCTTTIIVSHVSFCTILPKKGIGSLVIRQMFKKLCQNVCDTGFSVSSQKTEWLQYPGCTYSTPHTNHNIM